MSQPSTLSKILELFGTEESFESVEYVVKGARYLQKSLELLNVGSTIPESKLLEVAKRFYEKGIQVEGDLLLPGQAETDSDNSSPLNVRVSNFTASTVKS